MRGAVTVKGDSDLVAENIKKGIELFGITGTHEGMDLSDIDFGEFTVSTNSTRTVTISHRLNAAPREVFVVPIGNISYYTDAVIVTGSEPYGWIFNSSQPYIDKGDMKIGSSSITITLESGYTFEKGLTCKWFAVA